MIKKIILIILSVSLIYSCRKKEDIVEWDTDILTPLINSTLTINNLLTDSLLVSNADSSVKVVYQNEFYNLVTDSLIKVPDTTVTFFFPPFPTGFFMSAGYDVINRSGENVYNLNGGVELIRATVKSGFVKLEARNEVKQKVNVTYTLPSAKLNGAQFQIVDQIPAATSSGPGYYSKLFSIAGYDIDLTGIAGNKVNTMQVQVFAEMADSVTMLFGDSIIVTNSVIDLVPGYAKGYFGSTTIDIGPEESDFSLFNKVIDGSIDIHNVNLDFSIENNVGIDAQVTMKELVSKNTNTSVNVPLAAAFINTPININRAIENGNTINSVIPGNWSYSLNNNNSNTTSLIENMPNKIGYELKLITNPFGNISGSNDFLYSDKTIKVKLNMEMPLHLAASNFTLVDTLDFSINNKSAVVEQYNSGKFILNANNGFPFDASIQIYMLNEQQQVVDSLFTNSNYIVSADLDVNNKVSQKKLTQLIIPVSKEKLNTLFSTKKMKVWAKFNTSSNPQQVKIYDYYGIDIKLIGDFNYSVELK